ncbi:MAG: DUF1987 domain-containing protein [Bacteroidota bacterium]
MEAIAIEGTSIIPTVNFDPCSGKLELSGLSIHEDATSFYVPLLDWIAEYSLNPQKTTEINIKFKYFNTSTSKCILDILRELGKIHGTGSEVMVNWYYEEEDEDLLAIGEDYKSVVTIPFNMIKYED